MKNTSYIYNTFCRNAEIDFGTLYITPKRLHSRTTGSVGGATGSVGEATGSVGGATGSVGGATGSVGEQPVQLVEQLVQLVEQLIQLAEQPGPLSGFKYIYKDYQHLNNNNKN